MGIREYFKEHPEKDLKLQDIEIEFEDEKKELKFDPETEISDSDWQGISRQLEADRENNDWWHFAWQAMNMKILKPENFTDLKIDDRAWQGMSRELKAYRENNDWRSFAEQAMSMFILAGHKVEITDQGLDITLQKEELRLKPKKPRPERKKF